MNAQNGPRFPVSHNGAEIAYQMMVSEILPWPKTLLELATRLEQVQPRLKYPVRLLRLMHDEPEASFDRIQEIVYEGREVENILHAVYDANSKLKEFRVPYRIGYSGQMVTCISCPDA